jgi:hypothetical protein
MSRSSAVTVSVDSTNGRKGQSHVNSLYSLLEMLLSGNTRPIIVTFLDIVALQWLAPTIKSLPDCT